MTARLVLLSIALVAAAAVLKASGTAEPPRPHAPLASLPAELGEWRAVRDKELDADTLAVLRADDYVSRVYAGPGGGVDLFVGYYRTQSEGATIHSPLNCLPGAGWQPLTRRTIEIDGGARTITSNLTVIQKGLDKRLVLYWYQSPVRTVASEYAAKAFLVLDSLRYGRSDAALVRIIVPHHQREGEVEAGARRFVRHLAPALDSLLPR